MKARVVGGAGYRRGGLWCARNDGDNGGATGGASSSPMTCVPDPGTFFVISQIRALFVFGARQADSLLYPTTAVAPRKPKRSALERAFSEAVDGRASGEQQPPRIYCLRRREG